MKNLKSNDLKVRILEKGAELTSITNLSTQTEYLWQADPTFWGRKAPVLFPIVGLLNNNHFTYQGRSYDMKQHGFARDMNFEVLKETDNSIRFALRSKGKTTKQFPFHFALQIEYTLVEKTLTVTYRVINPFLEDLYFSIGGHPGFNCPIQEGEKRSDYQLVFNEKETTSTQLIVDGLRNGETQTVLDNENTIALTDELFDNDALILSNLKSNTVSLQKGDTKFWTFDFSGFPYLGIWSKNRKSPFVCIEPWFGIADKVGQDPDFTKKEGVIKLKPSEVFECSYTIEFH